MSQRRGVTDFLSVFESDKSIFFDIETDLLITLDDGGNINAINPAFERVLGYKRNDVIGRSLILYISMQSLNASPPRLCFLVRGGGEIVFSIAAWKYRNHQHYIIFRRC